MPARFGTAALAPVLRVFAGPAPGQALTEQTAGNLRSSGVRASGKHVFGRTAGTIPHGGASEERSELTAPPETPSAMPSIGEPRKALLPCAPSKTLCIPRSAVKKRRGGPEPQPCAPSAPSSKHVSDAVTSSRNVCSKSSTSSSFWNWSSLPQPSWRNSSS